jgi:hypothetical protein
VGAKTLDDGLETIDDRSQGRVGFGCDAVGGGLDAVVECFVGGCTDFVIESLVSVVRERLDITNQVTGLDLEGVGEL